MSLYDNVEVREQLLEWRRFNLRPTQPGEKNRTYTEWLNTYWNPMHLPQPEHEPPQTLPMLSFDASDDEEINQPSTPEPATTSSPQSFTPKQDTLEISFTWNSAARDFEEIDPQPALQPETTYAPRSFRHKIAEICRHNLHPGTPESLDVCPVCRVKGKLGSLQILTNVWFKNGGPSCDVEKCQGFSKQQNDLYWKLCTSWHAERAALACFVDLLETWTEQEQAWETETPGVLDAFRAEIKSSEDALELARKHTPGMEWENLESSVEAEPKEYKLRKRVSWGEDVVESPPRPEATFRRTRSTYEPGRWASRNEQGWIDTSFCLDKKFGSPEYDDELDNLWDEGHADMNELAARLEELSS